MCLSAYLVLRPPHAPHEVLLGRMDPAGPWFEVAAVDPPRAKGIGDRWVLPATQLLLGEAPDQAARRLGRELLGRDDLSLGSARVFSEAYLRGNGSADPHWDLHFVYLGRWAGAPPDASFGRLWKELRFVDLTSTSASAFGRGHADVLALAGLAPGGAPSP